MYSHIEAKDNQIVKHIAKLSQDSKYRRQCGLAVVHGSHLIEEAIAAQVLTTLVIDASKIAKHIQILDKVNNVLVYSAATKVVHKLNILDSEIDLVGVIACANNSLTTSSYNEDCILLHGIQNPGNLGGIFRVAKAAGINNVLVSSNSVDVYNPKVLRASQGAIFGLNIFTNIDVLDFIDKYNYEIAATTPVAHKSLYDTNLIQPIAWIFGNEGSGLGGDLLNKVKTSIAIPMYNDTESLNVVMAATVCLFEQMRQRCYR